MQKLEPIFILSWYWDNLRHLLDQHAFNTAGTFHCKINCSHWIPLTMCQSLKNRIVYIFTKNENKKAVTRVFADKPNSTYVIQEKINTARISKIGHVATFLDEQHRTVNSEQKNVCWSLQRNSKINKNLCGAFQRELSHLSPNHRWFDHLLYIPWFLSFIKKKKEMFNDYDRPWSHFWRCTILYILKYNETFLGLAITRNISSGYTSKDYRISPF